MIRKILLFIGVLSLVFFPFSSTSHAVLSTPAIYYIPHQDDETLSMSVDILNHLAVGRRVIVVLYSDGGASTAINYINGVSTSAWWGTKHDPAKEGYSPLTTTDFIEARNNEFKAACLQLGISPADIHIRPLGSNEAVTLDDMKNLIREYERLYPGASHKAMSYKDSHPVHAIAGQALNELYNAGEVSDARFFVSRYDWNNIKIGTTYTATTSQKTTISHAVEVYRAWNPLLKSYAIGYHSVYDQFEAYKANPQNRIHKPNE